MNNLPGLRKPAPGIGVLLLLTILALFSSPGYARQDFQFRGEFMQAKDQQGAKISAAQAGNLAKQKYGGKVLKISTKQSNSGVIYQVRLLLDSGKIINVTVDGTSGTVR